MIDPTKHFYDLTPDKILDAVELTGLRCTGRCLTLNSMENRVYEVEIETEGTEVKSRSDSFRVVKFYRPGRWSKEQLEAEHQFLLDLQEAEVPVVAPLKFDDGSTLYELTDLGIYCTVFPKQGGRPPEELSEEHARWLGRLIARMHSVGTRREANCRLALTPEVYGTQNLEFILNQDLLPPGVKNHYVDIVQEIIALATPLFEKAPLQRIHGDCHPGNILWGSDGPFFLDFDDMVRGPAVQDIWLVNPGRDEESLRTRNAMLDGYEEMRPFPWHTLNLIEPLRALRFIHFSAWIGKRWSDPFFPKYFPQYGTQDYWMGQIGDLTDQRDWIINAGLATA